MTPEQTRNYWILEGYPLMPEWIEFCQLYASGEPWQAQVSIWWQMVSKYHNVDPLQGMYFDFQDGQLVFVVEGIVTYKEPGEDHAK